MKLQLKKTLNTSAAKELIHLIESGTYEKMKQNKTLLEQSKAYLRDLLEPYPAKRHEFKELNWVAKFIPKKIWETDNERLIEDLLCYIKPEIALSVIKLDTKRIKSGGVKLDAYLLPKSHYVRPTLNKFGKSKVKLTDFLFGAQTEVEMVAEIKACSFEEKKYEEIYNHFKESSNRCSVLLEQRKVTTPYGSVSLIENKPKWELKDVYRDFGEDLFINFGKVDMAKLEELIIGGAVPNGILSNHRVLKDIRLDFVVMDLAGEEKAMNFHRNRQIKTSMRRFG